MKEIIQKTKQLTKNKPLFVGLLATIPTLFLWISATISFLYVNYLGPIIFSISEIVEIIIFLALPLAGLSFGILAHRKKSTKLTKTLIVVNGLLLVFTILASFLLT